MADKPRSQPDEYAGVPRWVKASAAIVISLIVLFGVLHLAGVAGNHVPGPRSTGHHATTITLPG